MPKNWSPTSSAEWLADTQGITTAPVVDGQRCAGRRLTIEEIVQKGGLEVDRREQSGIAEWFVSGKSGLPGATKAPHRRGQPEAIAL